MADPLDRLQAAVDKHGGGEVSAHAGPPRQITIRLAGGGATLSASGDTLEDAVASALDLLKET